MNTKPLSSRDLGRLLTAEQMADIVPLSEADAEHLKALSQANSSPTPPRWQLIAGFAVFATCLLVLGLYSSHKQGEYFSKWAKEPSAEEVTK